MDMPLPALPKLKSILIIDLLIVSIASGSYFYLQSQGLVTMGPQPATFSLTDLVIDPNETEAGEPVAISVNITNIGETEGNYTVELMVNNLSVENQTVSFTAGESNITQFIINEQKEGNYTVTIGDLSGSFTVKPAPPVTSNLVLTRIAVNPYEAWIGETVTISVTANNPTSSPDTGAVKLTVNNEIVETKQVTLGAGESTNVDFTYNVTAEGSYNIKVNSLFSGFIVVPTGMHTLMVISSPKQGVDLKFNGHQYKTPYRELVPVGVPQTVEVPAADPTGKFTFLNWEDGSRTPVRSITINSRTIIQASFSGGTSCPSLFMWNGTGYSYVSDVSNHGWLGYIDYVNSDGSLVFWKNNPWDYVPLDRSQLESINNVYNLTLVQRWNEIFYLDQAYMVAVDHPVDVNVYSTMVEQYLDPNYMGQIYTVSKNPLTPISAVNEKGENVLTQISKTDDVFTPGINGIQSNAWNNINWNRLTLNLGNLANAKQIKLVVKAVVDWGSPDDYNNWLNYFFDPTNPVPDGTQITPPPLMEVKAANGSWIPVPESRQFPLPPDMTARTYVVDLTGLFPTNDYSLRISNFWNVTFDYIGVNFTPQQNITIHKIDPTAYMYQSFQTGSLSSGSFTKYGNVTDLVTSENDQFVIGRQGDAVSMQFDAATLPQPSDGMVRDYFFFDSCWFKDENGNWGFGFGFTVDPLPFSNMTGFPYPQTESYPNDTEHTSYLTHWNTRVISPIAAGSEFPENLPIIILATTIVAMLVVNLTYIIFVRKQKSHTANEPVRI
jgi:hypothetical protein